MLTTLDELAVPDASPIAPPQSPVASQAVQNEIIESIGTLTPGSWLSVEPTAGQTYWFGVGDDGGLWLLTPADNYATPNYITTLSNVSQVPVPPSVMPAVPGKTPPAMMLPNAPPPIIPPSGFVGPPTPIDTTNYGPLQVTTTYSPNTTTITVAGSQSSIVINNTTGQVTIVIVRNNVSTFTWILVPPYR